MSPIFIPVLVLSGIGLVLAVLLALGRKAFFVNVDERHEKLMEILPGANCGGCGYPGCSGYAAALVGDGVAPSLCPPGGPDLAGEIGRLLGVEVGDVQKMVARVACAGDADLASDRVFYNGIADCSAAHALAGGPKSCVYGCLGLGSCKTACLFDAVVITEKGLAYIDNDKCTGCAKCVDACPRHLITMVPADEPVHVLCNNPNKAKQVKAVCSVGCTGCKACTKASKRMTMDGALASVDYTSDTEISKEIAFTCPQGAILDTRLYGTPAWCDGKDARAEYEAKREAWKAEKKAKKAAAKEQKEKPKSEAGSGNGKNAAQTDDASGGEG